MIHALQLSTYRSTSTTNTIIPALCNLPLPEDQQSTCHMTHTVSEKAGTYWPWQICKSPTCSVLQTSSEVAGQLEANAGDRRGAFAIVAHAAALNNVVRHLPQVLRLPLVHPQRARPQQHGPQNLLHGTATVSSPRMP